MDIHTYKYKIKPINKNLLFVFSSLIYSHVITFITSVPFSIWTWWTDDLSSENW